MKVVECDRCRDQRPADSPDTGTVSVESSVGNKNADLCQRCAKEILEWLRTPPARTA